MSELSDSTTDLSLLSRVRNATDQEAWEEFVNRYGGRIFRWCRGWGIQESDAQDVTQDVLIRLTRQMRNFKYDPQGRFRSWLRQVAFGALSDFFAALKAPEASSLSEFSVLHELDSQTARDALLDSLDEECQQELMGIALRMVKKRLDEKTWQAFDLNALQQVSAKEVAERLGINIASVYQARSRAQNMIKEELKLLDSEE